VRSAAPVRPGTSQRVTAEAELGLVIGRRMELEIT
jgi:hypothetical protein